MSALFTASLSWLPFEKQTKQAQAEVSEEIDLIEIDVSSVSATIIPENRDNIEAELEGKGKVNVKQHGDSISVEYKRRWSDLFSSFNKSKLTVYIPEEYNQDMTINIGSGNLNYHGQSKNQPMELNNLSLDMSSGNVELKHLATRHFEHDGSSGHVDIDSLATETGSFDISSGSIDLKHYTGQVEAELSSGKLKVQMDKLTDSVDIDVSSGNVLLDLPKNADFMLNGEVSSGTISNAFPLKNTKENKHDIRGTHGSGKHNLDLSVSSGRIEVY
jgi:lia operon protein LiaG